MGVGLLCVAFVGVTIVWLHLDQGTPLGNDASRHFEAVFNFHDQMTPLYWFHFENNGSSFYPPLVYLVAVLGTVPAGLSMDGPVLAINVVFVPVFAAGCYGVAREAFGRAAGLPAAIFALAAPMAIGLSHVMLLDLPLAAMVAVTTWALLAGNRFANARLALLTGILVGLGMLTKQLFLVYVAPVAALIVLRGGWRNWRGVALFCAAAAVVGGPWYIRHLAGLRGITGSATAQAAPGLDINPGGTDYTRFSLENYEWYGWAFINAHWYLPLTLVFVGGAIVTLRRARRDRRCGYLPELIAGILAGYVGVALLVGFQDPRYSFPSACFIAALGVGWIAKAKPRVRAGATLVLVGLLALNTLAISTDALGSVELRLPGGEPVRDNGFRLPGGEPLNITGVEGRLVLLADHGYTSGEPERARTLDLLEAAANDGVTAFSSEERAETVDKLNDIEIFARTIPIDYLSQDNPLIRSAKGIMLYRRPVRLSDPAPCQRFSDGTGLYVLRAVTDEQLRAPDPRRAPNRYCPL
jgi:uncharacterized membrane protein